MEMTYLSGQRYKSGFQMTVEKNNIKQLLRPITTGANSAMNQSENQSEKSRVQEVIGWTVLLLIGWKTDRGFFLANHQALQPQIA